MLLKTSVSYSLVIFGGAAGLRDDEDLPQPVWHGRDLGTGRPALPSTGTKQYKGGGGCC